MKILQVNCVYKKGSTGRIVYLISEMLTGNGVENWIACQYDDSGASNVFSISSKLDMKLHALLSRITGKNASFSVRATRKLLGIMDDIQPDVVHLHNIYHVSMKSIQIISHIT